MIADPFASARKPCASPYPCGRTVQTQVKVQRPICQPCRRRLANLRKRNRTREATVETVTTTLPRAQHDAVISALRTMEHEEFVRDADGLPMDILDRRDALRAMERAAMTRPAA